MKRTALPVLSRDPSSLVRPKHLGPGPHPSGSPQSVHGTSGGEAVWQRNAPRPSEARTIAEAEDAIRFATTEHGFVFSSSDGKLLGYAEGKGDQVEYPSDVETRGQVMLHNHPVTATVNSDLLFPPSISFQDFDMALKNDHPAELRVVGGERTYVMRFASDVVGDKEFGREAFSVADWARRDVIDSLLAAEWPLPRIRTVVPHLVWQRLAETELRGYIEYESSGTDNDTPDLPAIAWTKPPAWSTPRRWKPKSHDTVLLSDTKHLGPGDHPSGSPQSVHGTPGGEAAWQREHGGGPKVPTVGVRGGTGRRALRRARERAQRLWEEERKLREAEKLLESTKDPAMLSFDDEVSSIVSGQSAAYDEALTRYNEEFVSAMAAEEASAGPGEEGDEEGNRFRSPDEMTEAYAEDLYSLPWLGSGGTADRGDEFLQEHYPGYTPKRLEQTFEYTDPETGLSAQMDDIRVSPYTVTVSGRVWAKENGRTVHAGKYTRTFMADGEVYHDSFEMESRFQSAGFGSRFYQHLEQQYKLMGAKVVTLNANMDVGGYAWARMGFDFGGNERLRLAFSLRWDQRYGDTPRPNYKHAWELAAIRGPDGHAIGKEVMLGSSWNAHKYLDEESEGYKVGELYYASKRRGSRTGKKFLGPASVELLRAMVEQGWEVAAGTKHMGPGPHPSGSDQSVHGKPEIPTQGPRGGTGRRAIRRAKERLERLAFEKLERDRAERQAEDWPPSYNPGEGWVTAPGILTEPEVTEPQRAPMPWDSHHGGVPRSGGDPFPAEELPTNAEIALLNRTVDGIIAGRATQAGLDQARAESTPLPEPEQLFEDEIERQQREAIEILGRNGIEADAFLHTYYPGYAGPTMFRDTFTFADGPTGYRTAIDDIRVIDAGRLLIAEGRVIDTAGNYVGNFTRNFDQYGEVHHALFSMTHDQQGGGFGSRFYEHTERHYELMGAKQVTILANISVGGYAWARMGFDYHTSIPGHDARLQNQWRERYGAGIPVPKYRYPWELAVMRGPDGFEIGKQVMLGSSWSARKKLDPSSPGYQVGKLYYATKQLAKVGGKGTGKASVAAFSRMSAASEKRSETLPTGLDAKHLGPGPHPSGSDQSVHGSGGEGFVAPTVGTRGGTGRRALRRARALAKQKWEQEQRRKRARQFLRNHPNMDDATQEQVLSQILSGELYQYEEARRLVAEPAEPLLDPATATDRELLLAQEAERYSLPWRPTRDTMARAAGEEFLQEHYPGYLPSRVWKAFEYTDPETGFHTSLDRVFYNPLGVQVTGTVYTETGLKIGEFKRVFHPAGEVYHEYFEMDSYRQKTGFGSRFYQNCEEQYELMGAKAVTLAANLDVGGYAWARMGFDWDLSQAVGEYDRSRIEADFQSLWKSRYPDPSRLPPDFAHAWELASLTGPDGSAIGKEVLLGSEWMAVKRLDKDDPGYKVGQLYYAMKRQQYRESGRSPRTMYVHAAPQAWSRGDGEPKSRTGPTPGAEAKHLGPGPHPSGTDQDVHGKPGGEKLPTVGVRGGTGRRAIRRARERAKREAEVARRQEQARRFVAEHPDLASDELELVVDQILAGEREEFLSSVAMSSEAPAGIPKPEEVEFVFEGGEDIAAARDLPEDFGARAHLEALHSLPWSNDPELGDEVMLRYYPGYTPERLRAAFEYDDPETGFRSEITSIATLPLSSQLVVDGSVYDRRGVRVGDFTRNIYRDGTIHHDVFEMDASVQGRGFGSRFFQNAERQYKLMGAKEITLAANMKVGGYAWARMGFDWSEDEYPLRKDAFAAKWVQRYDEPVPEFSHAWELAALKGPDGHAIGKEALLGSSWFGRKSLDDDSEGYKVGLLYYESKRLAAAASPAPTARPLGELADLFNQAPVGIASGARRWRRSMQERYENDPDFRTLADVSSLYTQGEFTKIRAFSEYVVTGELSDRYEGSIYPRWIEDNFSMGAFSSPLAEHKTYFEGQELDSEGLDRVSALEAAAVLQESIATSEPLEIPIFRGTQAHKIPVLGEPNEWGERFNKYRDPHLPEVGEIIDIVGTSSFTADSGIAESFASGRARGQHNANERARRAEWLTVYEIRPGGRALNVSPVSPWNQKEFITSGKFKVVEVREWETNVYSGRGSYSASARVPGYHIVLEQVATWDVDVDKFRGGPVTIRYGGADGNQPIKWDPGQRPEGMNDEEN